MSSLKIVTIRANQLKYLLIYSRVEIILSLIYILCRMIIPINLNYYLRIYKIVKLWLK